MMLREKDILLTARVMSMIFHPFYLPIVGLLCLFFFSYLSLLPWSYKLLVLLLVYFFTVPLPTILIHFYRRYQGWSLIELGHRERRMIPYLISIVCYFTCLYIMDSMHIPHFMGAIVISALLVQIICAFINVWWKISTHTAAIGGVAGAVFAFSEWFDYNPVWWLCVTFLLGGILGTSRMILRQHSLSQVTIGFIVGFLCAAISILFI